MHIVRYAEGSGPARVAILDEAGIAPLEEVADLAELLRLPLAGIRSLTEEAAAGGERLAPDGVRLLAPVDGRTEVWAAGVTYERSREARVEESGQLSVYGAVYEADRPELFLKSVPWRVRTDGQPAGLRGDADNSVPEPELALLVNRHGEIVGATVCDDLTARSVEGENPLYLPQAKIYTGSCSLAARIRPWWEIADPAALGIRMRVLRDGGTAFKGETSTASLHRTFDDLVSWLYRELDLPDGAVLATGTGIVPPLDAGVRPGDTVEIEIDEVGTLTHELVVATPRG
ncbi:fumarylacetoacetate hydrolase family protein [Streptomyces pathocidini]|uniref:Fumarylacetoacetate hydrolase family protein n=1 Tax=Streptomyces pathocidini TaxID=1650571 RepID=A0ABW7UP12_9ACTN|nr:fumarylacetoacetate hydrolase family protein [Streptomyces pathocidini]